jgi:hypothetical protein
MLKLHLIGEKSECGMKLVPLLYRYAFVINFLIPSKTVITMARRVSKFRRLWRISPRLAMAYLTRRVKRQARQILPGDEWNLNWLGEEMRPFNSLR